MLSLLEQQQLDYQCNLPTNKTPSYVMFDQVSLTMLSNMGEQPNEEINYIATPNPIHICTRTSTVQSNGLLETGHTYNF